jgi:hypothetical protein
MDAQPVEPEFVDDVRGLVKSELEPGERLLWAGEGNPRPGRPLVNHNPLVAPLWGVGMLGVGALFLAARFGAFGRFFAFHPTDAGALLMFGLISVLIGVLVLLGVFAGWCFRRVKRNRSAKSLYALTDRRVIIWKPREGTEAIEVHTVPRGKFSNVHRVEYPDGSGDLVFEFSQEMYYCSYQFEGVAEVRRVEALVRNFLLVSAPS